MKIMKATLDLSGELFDDLVDMENTILSFDFPDRPPPTLCIEMRDVLLRTRGRPSVPALALTLGSDTGDTDLRLARGRLEIEKPTAADLLIAQYDIARSDRFLLAEDGRPRMSQQSWPDKPEGYEYNLGSVVMDPYGECQLTVHSPGRVTLYFDPADLTRTST